MFIDQKLQCPYPEMESMLEECGSKSDVMWKFYELLMRVYADHNQFDNAFKVFDYMSEKGLHMPGRSCMIFLTSLKNSRKFESVINLFNKMVDSGVELTREIDKAKQWIGDMCKRKIKQNPYAYNSLIDFYVKKQDFQKVDQVFKLMKMTMVEPNVATYTSSWVFECWDG